MRLIDISEYNHKSMMLGRPIYDKHKRVLLAAGRVIDPKISPRLESMGIKYIFVEDEVSKGISIEDILDMPTWTDAIEVVKVFHEQAKNQKKPDFKDVQKVAANLIEEVKYRPTLVLIPSGTVAKELQPYAHAVNVTILALLTGKKLKYNDLKLRDLAIGTLLHDIGKAVETNYEKHPEAGFNYLREFYQLSVVAAHIAYQHHETMDGEGFPRKINHKEFLEIAQICGLANKYDNLINKDNLSPDEAMEAVMATSDRAYSHHIVNAFCLSVSTYPPGTKVLINNKPAIVTQLNRHLHRPVVKILSNEEEVDLTEYPTYIIKPDHFEKQ